MDEQDKQRVRESVKTIEDSLEYAKKHLVKVHQEIISLEETGVVEVRIQNESTRYHLVIRALEHYTVLVNHYLGEIKKKLDRK